MAAINTATAVVSVAARNAAAAVVLVAAINTAAAVVPEAASIAAAAKPAVPVTARNYVAAFLSLAAKMRLLEKCQWLLEHY